MATEIEKPFLWCHFWIYSREIDYFKTKEIKPVKSKVQDSQTDILLKCLKNPQKYFFCLWLSNDKFQNYFKVKILAQKFRFMVTIKPEPTWGEVLSNGTIIGSVGSVSSFN